MRQNLNIDLRGYIVKAYNGQTVGVCSDKNKIYIKQLNKEIPENMSFFRKRLTSEKVNGRVFVDFKFDFHFVMF